MKVVSNPKVTELIEAQGGRLFVWTDLRKCCSGGITYLSTGSSPAPDRRFSSYEAAGFELWFDPGNLTPPDELHLDVKGWRNKHVEAYWNGCVFAV